MIHLEEVTPDNWQLGLKVSKSQQKFVASDMELLARAYAFRNHRSNAYVIYSDSTPVGMALYYDSEKMNAYFFSQFFIDENFQRNGYGSKAIQLIIEQMKKDGRYHKILLCYLDGNEDALKLYQKFGFTQTGRIDNEIDMELLI
ncbi:spermine/spermidine acetyltransferase, putative [Lachnospiraceae bacterium KM106-2]|nr:spermine/spermidine acetyltransferase, putative [Lachnospiraceae bacterium KM106-2]